MKLDLFCIGKFAAVHTAAEDAAALFRQGTEQAVGNVIDMLIMPAQPGSEEHICKNTHKLPPVEGLTDAVFGEAAAEGLRRIGQLNKAFALLQAGKIPRLDAAAGRRRGVVDAAVGAHKALLYQSAARSALQKGLARFITVENEQILESAQNGLCFPIAVNAVKLADGL